MRKEYTVEKGSKVKLTATPVKGYRFTHWQSNDKTLGAGDGVYSEKNPLIIKAHFDTHRIVAHFEKVQDGSTGTTPTEREYPKTIKINIEHTEGSHFNPETVDGVFQPESNTYNGIYFPPAGWILDNFWCDDPNVQLSEKLGSLWITKVPVEGTTVTVRLEEENRHDGEHPAFDIH